MGAPQNYNNYTATTPKKIITSDKKLLTNKFLTLQPTKDLEKLILVKQLKINKYKKFLYNNNCFKLLLLF